MRPRSVGLSILGALGIAGLVAGTASAGSNTTTLDNGAELTATISTPTQGDTYLIPPPDPDIDVPVVGNASIGLGAPDVHWTYVIDVSGSTDNEPCGMTNILACEKEAALNLNADVVASGSALDVGVAVYATSGASADMQIAGGEQPLTAPDSGDVEVVVNSTFSQFGGDGGVNQYTPKNVGVFTNFAAGLSAALVSVDASSAGTKNVVFMSDGGSTDGLGSFPGALDALVATGANIYTFAVGTLSTCDEGDAGTLQDIADAADAVNEGSCTEVPDPTQLPEIVADLVATQMTGVSLTVDGSPVGFDTNSNPPPFPGPDDTDVTATAANQTPGAHEVCLTAEGEGPTGENAAPGNVTQCETYYVYGFELTPPTATNELSEDQDHAVTATLLGEPGELDGFNVDFEVTAGPNTGEMGSVSTDTDGDAEFAYTNPNVDPSGLGTDTIEATVNVNGETATLAVTKDWVDTIPPDATCLPSVNPKGNKQPQAPGKGGQGQNQDGFYVIDATDNIWPDDSLQVFVTDSGSGNVFGPFDVDTNIKYTEDADATPEMKTIGGPNSAVDWHIIGTGDAEVTAVDGSGNVSDAVSCLVPPPPK